MKISLVLATKNRKVELERFLNSLSIQIYKNIELIIVDQNDDERLIPIINKFSNELKIIHVKSKPGLSVARNKGLNYISGDIVGFPDDDCWYDNKLLLKINNFFKNNLDLDGITGRATDEKGEDSIGIFDKVPGLINKYNVWYRANSNTIFFRKKVINTIGGFDEQLGVGSGTLWGSAEDIDYPLRAIKKGFKVYFNPELTVFHEKTFEKSYKKDSPKKVNQKVFYYSAGMGRVLKKHNYPFWYVTYKIIRPLIGACVFFSIGKFRRASHSWNVFKGRLRGWISL
ncbi:glycosyltransferase family 2 protein [Bacillus smithii]|uniref:Glycosyltransferase 2-like domain-containing protein n=1 Tax=Bacillus smithii 7_3_47FAA TaxID=665952 RepID=G9QJM6_9BACI|nr:glycosyltransferase [Bacillus smithii]EHL78624.1 hypothetical protein HMPREF1015_01909 [Bacillus smithii 7_3_47FAA]